MTEIMLKKEANIMKSVSQNIQNPNAPILFVDDDPVAHTLIKSYLKNWNIESAYSAEEALEILKTRPILIVITDIRMPGMDGIQLLREIRKIRGIIQVIIVTASNEIDDLINAFEAGANDFLLKPPQKEDIEAALKNTVMKLNRWKTIMKELFHRRKDFANHM